MMSATITITTTFSANFAATIAIIVFADGAATARAASSDEDAVIDCQRCHLYYHLPQHN